MPDVFTQAKRSAVMRQIRSTGNKDTELRLIKIMRAAGIRGWRRCATVRVNQSAKTRAIAIRPDFVFRRQRIAVFVDGCFFHGCPRHATWPKNNAAFWRSKIEGNRARDRRQTRLLRARGWTVVRIWEHSLSKGGADKTVARLQRALEGIAQMQLGS